MGESWVSRESETLIDGSPPGGVGGCRLGQSSLVLHQGVVGSFPLILGSERVRIWVVDRFWRKNDSSILAYLWTQVFHTQRIRVRPMNLFQGVSHHQTP